MLRGDVAGEKVEEKACTCTNVGALHEAWHAELQTGLRTPPGNPFRKCGPLLEPRST